MSECRTRRYPHCARKSRSSQKANQSVDFVLTCNARLFFGTVLCRSDSIRKEVSSGGFGSIVITRARKEPGSGSMPGD